MGLKIKNKYKCGKKMRSKDLLKIKKLLIIIIGNYKMILAWMYKLIV
jgi:hypothetical protein